MSLLSDESRREQDARYAAMTREVWAALGLAMLVVGVLGMGLWWGGWW